MTAQIFLLTSLALFMVIERVLPNIQYRSNHMWYARLFLLQAGGMLATFLIGLAIPINEKNIPIFPTFTTFFAKLPPFLNGIVGYVAVYFFFYWWHRIRHSNDFLWRIFHQIHHSTNRVQSLTALYAHPLDYASAILIINVTSYIILGFNLESALWTTAWIGVLDFFQHCNIRTPIWLGYIIGRPEMHRIHHEINKHSNNYAIPIWDALFGTYENSERQVDCGFESNRELKLKEMMKFIDVNK